VKRPSLPLLLSLSLSRLAAAPLDFALEATPFSLVLQHEPARRLLLQ